MAAAVNAAFFVFVSGKITNIQFPIVIVERRINASRSLAHLTYGEFQQFLVDELNLTGGTELHDLFAILTAIKYSPTGVTIADSSTLPN